MKPRREQGENTCIKRQRVNSKHDYPKAQALLFLLLQNGQARVAGDSSILAQASETSRWLLQSNGSCQTKQTISVPGLFRLMGGRFRSKTIKEGMGMRRNSKNLKCLLSYLFYISRLHTLFYLILTTNFITTIITSILYIGGEKTEV